MELIFDRELLKELIVRAIGGGQIDSYSEKCGVSVGYMMKFVNGEGENPPVPSLLMHMAEASDGRVDFSEFFEACGYGIDIMKEYEEIRKQRNSGASNSENVCEVVEINELFGLLAGLNCGRTRDTIPIKQLTDLLPMISFRAVQVK